MLKVVGLEGTYPRMGQSISIKGQPEAALAAKIIRTSAKENWFELSAPTPQPPFEIGERTRLSSIVGMFRLSGLEGLDVNMSVFPYLVKG